MNFRFEKFNTMPSCYLHVNSLDNMEPPVLNLYKKLD
jgi:hypothetical protein